jgi:diguanylate cyclase (GGDEF)-like protein
MTTNPTKVLLVDDDPAMLRLLSKWLETAGYGVTRAADGKEAARLIQSDPPQILVTDWEMPHMDGLELVSWMRSQALPNYVYTIFLTVRSGAADIIRSLEAGADDFVKKPVDKEELLARLKAASRVIEMEQRLSLMAKTDAMTGLATQRTFYEFMEREWARAERYRYPLACVMLDVDYFKRINDTHGHSCGDAVIRAIARVLSENCRASDVVCRYGGEEFCLLLPETDEENAALWAERTRERIAELRVTHDGKRINVSASLGVAERMADTASPQTLVDAADQALLVAKRSGRDRVVTFRSLTASFAAPSDESASHPAAILRNVPAKDVMTTVIASLCEDDTVGAASEYFLRFRISSAPVVDRDGKLVGVLSERDAMAIMLWPLWHLTKIKDVMKKNVVCYEENTPALIVYDFLCRVTIRGAVVVKDSRPTGVITRSSLLRYFTNSLAVAQPTSSHDERAATAGQIVSAVASSADPQQRINQAVLALVAETQDLQRRLSEQCSELVPCVVGGASRIQDLVNDLLAYSRYAQAETPAPAAEDNANDNAADPAISLIC